MNHKYRKAGLKMSQNDERVLPTGPPDEIEDVFSQYETIDENNMEPMQLIEKVEATVNPRTSSVNSESPANRSYLEVIDIDNSLDSEIWLTEKDDKSKEREESSNLHCPLKKSEVIEEIGYPLQNKKTAEYVNIDQ